MICSSLVALDEGLLTATHVVEPVPRKVWYMISVCSIRSMPQKGTDLPKSEVVRGLHQASCESP